MAKKLVLAYSGGLDTSCILKYLQLEGGYDVIAYIANVGQQEDFDEIKSRALATGAVAAEVVDLRREFVTDYIFPSIAGRAVYENRYLLGTALARPVIAKGQVDLAKREGADALGHGATGKGNDQVRFELAFAALAPRLEIVAPWKDATFLSRFQGRPDLLRYAEEHQIPVEASASKPFSTDENLLHKSYEAGALEDPYFAPEQDMFVMTRSPFDAPDKPVRLEIHYVDANPVAVENLDTGERHEDPLELFEYINTLAAEAGVGRIDIVENRFVGIKSRGVYETPAGTVLHHAIRDLEGIAMDREVQRLRDSLSPKFAELIYNGFWFSPEMDFLRGAFLRAQEIIDGSVRVALYKGNVIIEGRKSPSSLYDQELSSMDVEGGYDQKDAAGFIRINALRLKAHRHILRRSQKPGESK